MTWSDVARAQRFGPELARLAASQGLAVTAADGSTRPIPIAATPVIVEDAEWHRRQRLATRLSSAGLKMSRYALEDPGLRAELLGALSPLESALAAASFARLDVLATTRVDFFAGAAFKALEVNATIPAMQAYSDIAAHTFLEVVGRDAGVDAATIARWQHDNGSNARALYGALLAGYARLRPRAVPSRIAILCRRQDAQITELRHLRERFCAFGTEAEIVHPDELSLHDDCVRARGAAFDLVYRHLFVRRLEAPDLRGAELLGAETVRTLLSEPQGTRAVVLNPPASQVEVKSVFALLSEATQNGALEAGAGLDSEELAAIADAVPWTRRFRGAALVDQVADNPDAYVLKRTWDYGGRAVFIGRARDDEDFRVRVHAAWPDAPATWRAVCERAAADPHAGGFVVQEIVDARPQPHLLCTATGVQAVSLHVDYSAFASVGLDVDPAWGGVCRGSVSSVVNIMGGGGVVPLLRAGVARELERAMAAP